MTVRLIVDGLDSFSRIEPAFDVARGLQKIKGVTIIEWAQLGDANPAALVIEAFAVDLPSFYIDAMAAKSPRPVWLNLEYLSAESWVDEHHLLPSPHPTLPLCKHFFFPGFTPNTGGLIREANLLAERDAFTRARLPDRLRVFLFCYRNAAGENLLSALKESGTPVHCTVPEGTFATDLNQITGMRNNSSRTFVMETIPFAAQHAFDRLLWQHDVLFVRGEDSFVRAQWAGKPFVWQIYPQSESAHWTKLNAFLLIYCDGLEDRAALALRELWRAWNAEDSIHIGSAWTQFMVYFPALQAHAIAWSKKYAQLPDLAANLLNFYQKTTKI